MAPPPTSRLGALATSGVTIRLNAKVLTFIAILKSTNFDLLRPRLVPPYFRTFWPEFQNMLPSVSLV